jgi:hypothetical protein
VCRTSEMTHVRLYFYMSEGRMLLSVNEQFNLNKISFL